MGLLSEGSPLSWEETKKWADHVRKHGIIQFINQYKRLKDRSKDVLRWGDEVRPFLSWYSGISHHPCRWPGWFITCTTHNRVTQSLQSVNLNYILNSELRNYLFDHIRTPICLKSIIAFIDHGIKIITVSTCVTDCIPMHEWQWNVYKSRILKAINYFIHLCSWKVDA